MTDRPRLCPGVAASAGCDLAADPGDRYCTSCREALDRMPALFDPDEA